MWPLARGLAEAWRNPAPVHRTMAPRSFVESRAKLTAELSATVHDDNVFSGPTRCRSVDRVSPGGKAKQRIFRLIVEPLAWFGGVGRGVGPLEWAGGR